MIRRMSEYWNNHLQTFSYINNVNIYLAILSGLVLHNLYISLTCLAIMLILLLFVWADSIQEKRLKRIRRDYYTS